MAAPIRVLIVEDSEADAFLIVSELDRAGFDTTWERVETSGALKTALENKRWDVILAGYRLTSFNAPEALALVQESGLDIPFIIVSGASDEEIAIDSIRAGAGDCLIKGDLKRLVTSVRRELDQAAQRAERKQVEIALRKLELAVRRSANVIFMTDPEGKINYANPAFGKVYGYSEEESLGHNPSFLKSGLYDSAFYQNYWQDMLSEDGFQGDLVNKRKDGRLVEVEVTANVVRDQDGKILGFIAVQNDITEREEARRAVEERERRFRTLIENASDIIAVVDARGSFQFASPSILRIMGYRPEEIVGKRVFDFIHPDDVVSALEKLTLRMEDPATPRPGEFRLRHRNGGWRTLQTRGTVLTGPDGDRSLVLNARDVSDQKAAESALRESEERYREIFEASPLPMWLYERERLKILDVNQAAVDLYGYSREEFLRMTLLDLRSPEEGKRLMQNFRENPHPPARWHAGIWKHLKKDGTMIEVDVYTHNVTLGGREMRLGVQIDVTDQRVLEEQFRQAQKMEAIGQFAGGIAHDFNNLLTAILGYSDFVATQLGPSSPVQEEVEEILCAGERAAALTQQLLAFSRKQVLEPRVLDLNELVGRMERMLRRLLGETVVLASALAPDLRPVRADPGQIEQVIMNLVVNSRDAMPDGGRITIETANTELDETYARQHAGVKAGPFVMLAVSDTGFGMDEATKGRIFEPFFTTKGKGMGTGLGLSTVYGIVKQSGGHIWVYSEPGKGTTFKIYLAPAAEAVEAPPRVPPGPPPHGTETILLVEDDDSVRKLALTILESFGYAVLEAADGAAALSLAKNHSGPIHLVLTDLVMPDFGGAALIARLREFRPGVRALFMSGYTDGALFREGLLQSETSFIQKPFTSEALARKVRESLDGEM
jgi:two-component system cell cycle sensor histidine kinase/response regulator CckA